MSIDLGVLGARVNLNTKDFNAGIKDVKRGFQNIGTDAGKSVKKINFNFEKMARVATKASIAIAAVGAASAAMANEFSKGAKLIDQHKVFEGLAANIGRDAEKMVKQLKTATKGALSEVNAMAVSTQAIMSGMDFDNVTTALEYLQRYAKATGKSFQQLTTTVMTGLARGSVLMLDDAGIILDQASLIAEAEKKIGHALTEVEKKQLLVNAATEQMRRKLPALGGSMTTVSDKMQAMKTSLTDFRNAMSLKAFTVGMGGLKWLSQRFYDLILVMADVRIGAEIMKNGFVNAIGNMVVAVNNKLMDMIIGLRNALSKSLAGLWDQDNPITNAMKGMLNATVNGLDASLNALFSTNQKFLNAEEGQNLKLAKLYEVRKSIMADQAKWVQTFTIPTGGDTQPGSFDLSGSVGNVLNEEKAKATISPMGNALKALQDQINQLSFDKSIIGLDSFELAMREASFETTQLQEQYAALIPENPAIGQMIDQIRQLKIETADAAREFEKSQSKFKLIGDVLSDTMREFTQPLANSLAELAKTGKANLKDLAASMVETLQIFAAEKTAHFTMLAIFHSLMTYIDSYRAGEHAAKASTAISGAALMGSFVAGSALAGMAHDGMTSIPEDGTWLLKKNERVIDPETNEDLKSFLKDGGKGNTINMPVTINGGDEQGVLKALPAMKDAMLDAVSENIAGRGHIFKTIQAYT